MYYAKMRITMLAEIFGKFAEQNETKMKFVFNVGSMRRQTLLSGTGTTTTTMQQQQQQQQQQLITDVTTK